ncbi:hypothetical protein, partial [Lysinibacillus fusiformis]|uniref:hypothetical protein n=1 Tax=Lysinibacillus fusiformis TaxID=28031 RepID=UPI0020C16684
TAMNASYRNAIFRRIFLYLYITDNPMICKGLSVVFLKNLFMDIFIYRALFSMTGGDMMGKI